MQAKHLQIPYQDGNHPHTMKKEQGIKPKAALTPKTPPKNKNKQTKKGFVVEKNSDACTTKMITFLEI